MRWQNTLTSLVTRYMYAGAEVSRDVARASHRIKIFSTHPLHPPQVTVALSSGPDAVVPPRIPRWPIFLRRVFAERYSQSRTTFQFWNTLAVTSRRSRNLTAIGDHDT